MMDRCALEFIARRGWRRAEVWIIAPTKSVEGCDLRNSGCRP